MKPLTPSQRNVAAYMLAGWTRREIAKHLGVSAKCVGSHCLAVCKICEQQPDVPLAEILRALGVEPATDERPVIADAGARTGPAIRKTRPVTDDDVARAAELYAAGHRYPEIAQAMRRTVKSIGYMLMRHRKGQPQPKRPSTRPDSADEIVAAALDAARRRECVWL